MKKEDKKIIQAVKSVFIAIHKAYLNKNKEDQSVDQRIIDDVQEIIALCDSDGVTYEEISKRNIQHSKLIDECIIGSFDDGGFIPKNNKDSIVKMEGGEEILNDSLFKPKHEYNGEGLFDHPRVFYISDEGIGDLGVKDQLQNYLRGADNSRKIQIVPYFDSETAKEKLKEISTKIKKHCQEIRKEVMQRYGGDSTFEDPIEDIESAVTELDAIFESKEEVEFSDAKKTYFKNPFLDAPEYELQPTPIQSIMEAYGKYVLSQNSLCEESASDEKPTACCNVPLPENDVCCSNLQQNVLSLGFILDQIRCHKFYLKVRTKEYHKLSESERNSPEGIERLNEIKSVRESLKGHEDFISSNNTKINPEYLIPTNVGNYEKAFDIKEMSFLSKSKEEKRNPISKRKTKKK